MRMLWVGKKFAFYSSAMGEPLEVFKQERNKTALTIFKDPVAVWAVGGDGTEIKAGRSDGEATAVVQRRDDGDLGQGAGPWGWSDENRFRIYFEGRTNGT